MSRLYQDHLHKTIQALGSHALKDDWDAENVRGREKVVRGPNRWLEMKGKPEFYGKDFDFRVLDKDVFMPCSPAAQHFLWYSVGETQHWYTVDGYNGCVVDEDVLAGARREGLIRESDYVEDMNNENDNLMRQGE